MFKQVYTIDVPFGVIEDHPQFGQQTAILNAIVNAALFQRRAYQRKTAKALPADFDPFKGDVIIALDLTLWPKAQGATHLAGLFPLITRFPMFAYNYPAIENLEPFQGLWDDLRDRHFIFPLISFLSPYDESTYRHRYPACISKLFSGELCAINIEQINAEINALGMCDLQDIRNRFPSIILQGDHLVHALKIKWLGIDDENISQYLTSLFMGNIDASIIRYEDAEKELGNSINEFKEYVQESMLFGKKNSEGFTFRFLKRHIIPHLKQGFIEQFESEMVSRNVVKSWGNIPSEGTQPHKAGISEYHFVPKIFRPNDCFSQKAIIIMHRLLEQAQAVKLDEIDKIVIYDTGMESVLEDILRQVFQRQVIRIVHRGRNIRLFPYDDLETNERVLIVADVVNRGDLLREIITHVESHHGVSVSAIFAFIINTSLDLKSFVNTDTGDNIPFLAFLERKLAPVRPDKTPRSMLLSEKLDLAERFVFFWNTIDRLGKVERKSLASREKRTDSSDTVFRNYFEFIVDISGFSPDNMYPLRDFLTYLDIEDEKGDFQDVGLLIHNDTVTSRMLSKIICKHFKIEPVIISLDFGGAETRTLQSQDGNDIDGSILKGNVLIVDDGINSYHNLSRMAALCFHHSIPKEKILCCAFFARKNQALENDHIIARLKNDLSEHLKTGKPSIYYDSAIPFYLIDETISMQNFQYPEHFFRSSMQIIADDKTLDADVASLIGNLHVPIGSFDAEIERELSGTDPTS